MQLYGEKMTRRFAGLYDGEEVRAERRGVSWLFQMRCSQIGDRIGWYEFSPRGLWTNIGMWPTLERGLFVASLLRSGTHFYESYNGGRARPYTEEVYAELRGEPVHV